MDSEPLRQLADVETPTCTTNHLEPLGKDKDDESEDYNDISMLLVDTPVNSTAVDKSTFPESSPEISRIDVNHRAGRDRLEVSRIEEFAGGARSGVMRSKTGGSGQSEANERKDDGSASDATSISNGSTLSFQTHMSVGEELRCHCGKSFLSRGGLTKHKKVCSKPPLGDTILLKFQCQSCKKTFNESRYLKQHQNSKRCVERQSHLERGASVTSLEQVSMSLVLSESLASQRSEVVTLVCDNCGKVCKNKAGKSLHMKRCNEVFDSQDTSTKKVRKKLQKVVKF